MANPDGTAIWFELNTPDQNKAKDFYAATIGWNIAPSPMDEHGGYLIANAADGEGVAGLMTPPPGAPAFSGWSIYFGVGDVDAAADRVKALGGKIVFGPMDIPKVGRFAIAQDPQGVTFFLMKGDSPEDSTAFKQGPGNFGHGVWNELATPDPDGAFDFYGKLFGWTKAGAMPMGEMGEYAFIGTGTAPGGSSGQDGSHAGPGAVMSSKTTGAPARWNAYFHVADIDAAIAGAKAKGGAVLQEPNQIPGGDYSAKIADADGAQLGIAGPRHT